MTLLYTSRKKNSHKREKRKHNNNKKRNRKIRRNEKLGTVSVLLEETLGLASLVVRQWYCSLQVRFHFYPEPASAAGHYRQRYPKSLQTLNHLAVLIMEICSARYRTVSTRSAFLAANGPKKKRGKPLDRTTVCRTMLTREDGNL
jgi:hypothetical protein